MLGSVTKTTAEMIGRATAALGERAAGKRVFILMSGGVDSSVTAVLAVRAGICATGVTMCHLDDGLSARHAHAASALCSSLGIESLTFDLRRKFEECVIAPFRAAYERGETPNPCALCNPSVKFGLLWERIAAYSGRDDFFVVTGHYARTERAEDGGAALLRGVDRSKDQSYFLCMLPRAKIDRLLLPLGDWTKAQTREAARELGTPTPVMESIAEEPESMEICFLGAGDYRAILGAPRPGPILNPHGEKIGEHRGIEHFTVGQRKGLGLASREPLFVTEIRPGENAVVAAPRREAMTRNVPAADVNILAPEVCRDGALLRGKIRSQSVPAPCRVELRGEKRIAAIFDEPQFAPAPGQYLVLYDGDRLVAGGRIERAESNGRS